MLKNKTIKFDEDEWKQFESICNKRGYSRSKLLRKWVKMFIDKYISNRNHGRLSRKYEDK